MCDPYKMGDNHVKRHSVSMQNKRQKSLDHEKPRKVPIMYNNTRKEAEFLGAFSKVVKDHIYVIFV